jgi:hypothetical protein
MRLIKGCVRLFEDTIPKLKEIKERDVKSYKQK